MSKRGKGQEAMSAEHGGAPSEANIREFPGMKGRETQKSPDKQEDRVPRADNRGARIWPRVPGYQWGVGTVPWALGGWDLMLRCVGGLGVQSR